MRALPQAAAARPSSAMPQRNRAAPAQAIAPHGQSLDCDVRTTMEKRFAYDFSGVRVHTGGEADRSARAVGANAYTVGSDIVFRSGAYAPRSPQGRSLLTHELTHVAQQKGGGADPRRQESLVSHPHDAAEREASGNAERAEGTGSLSAAQPGSAVLHRSPLGIGLGIGLGVSAAVGLGFGIAAAAGAFDGDKLTDKELQDYLAYLQDNQSIEGKSNSADKAHAVVKRWKSGAAGFAVLIIPIRILLIQEMAAVSLSEAYQVDILDLIREAIPAERAHIFPAIKIDTLKPQFDVKRRKELDALVDEQDVAALDLSDAWTVPGTKKIVERLGDGGIIRKVIAAGFKFFRFKTAFDTWRYNDGRPDVEEELKGLQGNTDRRASPKRVRLRETLSNENAADTLYHEGTHAISPEPTTQDEYLKDEAHARVEQDGFRYRHGMEPVKPSYRTAKGKADPAAILSDVTGSPHYNPTNRERVKRRYVGEVETKGWETP
jgi:hypothetical protein